MEKTIYEKSGVVWLMQMIYNYSFIVALPHVKHLFTQSL